MGEDLEVFEGSEFCWHDFCLYFFFLVAGWMGSLFWVWGLEIAVLMVDNRMIAAHGLLDVGCTVGGGVPVTSLRVRSAGVCTC